MHPVTSRTGKVLRLNNWVVVFISEELLLCNVGNLIMDKKLYSSVEMCCHTVKHGGLSEGVPGEWSG